MTKLLIAITLLFSANTFAAQIDSAKTSFNWEGTKKVGDKHVGTIKLKSSKLTMNKDQVKSAEFVMDMNTINVTDLKGKWKSKLEGHLKDGDFFNVKKYPTAKLTLDKIADSKAMGKLTIRDKTVPVTIPFKKKGSMYSGTLMIDRTKFGITYGSANFFKKLVANKVINNEMKLNFTVAVK